MNCQSCGTANPVESKFCGNCGSKLGEQQANDTFLRVVQRTTRWSHPDMKEGVNLGDFAAGTQVRILEEAPGNPNLVKVTTEDDIDGWISRASLTNDSRPKRYRQHTAEAERPIAHQAPSIENLGLLPISIGVCAGLMVLGSFSPWAKVYGREIAGMSEGGILVLILGLVALGGLWLRYQNPDKVTGVWTAAGSLVVATIFAIYKINQIENAGKSTRVDLRDFGGSGSLKFVGIEWGLSLVLLAAIVGAVLAVILLIKDNNRINN